MSKFSASDAAFSGFRLVREHPKAVGAWAIGLTVLSLVVSALTIQLAGPQMTEFMAMSGDNSVAPEEMLRVLGSMAPLFGISMVYSLILYSVLLAAVNRMVLRPSDDRSAFLRLGADELRQAGSLVLSTLLMLGVYCGAVIVFGLLVGLAAAGGGGALTGIVGLIGFVGIGCLMIYFAVRLSFASAMTFERGKVIVTSSWAATKGHVGALLGAYILAVVMGMIVYALILVIVAAVGAIVSGDITSLGALFEPDMSSLEAFFTPMGIVRAVFSGVISVLTTLIVFAPAPTIYQILRDGRDGALEEAVEG